MLHPMQQPSPTSSSFAGLLAALASPAQSPGDRSSLPGHKSGVPGDRSSSLGHKSSPTWNEDGLADDVATLSYESALKAHARYRYADQSLTQLPDPVPFRFEETSSAASAPCPVILSDPERREGESKDLHFLAERAGIQASMGSIANQKPAANPYPAAIPAPRATANQAPESTRLRPTPFARNLKDASITIRMSQAECAQLHRRAAEAGLTVSAYLRSCTFEAESLRAMVKDTLTQLRSVPTQPRTANSAPPPRRSRFGKLTRWLAGLFTPWHGSPRVARA